MGSLFSNVIESKQEKIEEAGMNIICGAANEDPLQVVQGFAGFLGQVPLPGTGLYGKAINMGGDAIYTVIAAKRGVEF
jgi:hypothetical protein